MKAGVVPLLLLACLALAASAKAEVAAYNCSVQKSEIYASTFGARGCAGRGSPYCCSGNVSSSSFPGNNMCIADSSLNLYGGICPSSVYVNPACCPVTVANCTNIQANDNPASAYGHGLSGCAPYLPYCCNGTPYTVGFPGNFTCVPDISAQKYGGNCEYAHR